jgi:hypothetical protein
MPGSTDLEFAARALALELIRDKVEWGYDVDKVQQSWHGIGGPDYSAEIVANQSYTVHVGRVDGVDCDFTFSLRKLYAECKKGQLSLL